MASEEARDWVWLNDRTAYYRAWDGGGWRFSDGAPCVKAWDGTSSLSYEPPPTPRYQRAYYVPDRPVVGMRDCYGDVSLASSEAWAHIAKLGDPKNTHTWDQRWPSDSPHTPVYGDLPLVTAEEYDAAQEEGDQRCDCFDEFDVEGDQRCDCFDEFDVDEDTARSWEETDETGGRGVRARGVEFEYTVGGEFIPSFDWLQCHFDEQQIKWRTCVDEQGVTDTPTEWQPPDHYKQGNRECRIVMRDYSDPSGFVRHCELTAYKYLDRVGAKDDPFEDYIKAQDYLWFACEALDIPFEVELEEVYDDVLDSLPLQEKIGFLRGLARLAILEGWGPREPLAFVQMIVYLLMTEGV